MLYPNFVDKIIFPLTDIFLSLSIRKELDKWRTMQWLDKSELENIQLNGLKNILSHSKTNIVYYNELFRTDCEVTLENSVEILKTLPFLTKDLIKKNLPNRIVDKNRKIYTIESTSGSTGIHGEFFFDREAYSKTIAIQSLWWEWASFKYGNKSIQTGITPNRGFIKKIKDILFQVHYRPAFNLDEINILSDLNKLSNKKIKYLMGFASSLFHYADIADKNDINNIRLKSLISWGDKLFPHYRELIRKVFNAEVFDTYGACEGTMVAAECENHKLHIMSPHVFIELLDKYGNEVSPGEVGEVVVTRLDNYLMPLIRYKIGDLAIKSKDDKNCKCNRQLPIIEKIIGRDTDIIYTKNGKPLIIHFFTGIFAHYPEIKQFQIFHKNDFILEIRYLKGNKFEKSILKKIENEIKAKAEDYIQIDFKSVETIDASKSGKLQMIISE